MALINCPECGKEISDKAASCPNCGCPIKIISSENTHMQKMHEKDNHSEKNKVLLV